VRRLALAAALLLVSVPVHAQQTHLLVVVGLGGDDAYRERFHGWASRLVDAATGRYGVPADNVRYLGEKPELDPERIADRSTRDNIEAAVRDVARRAGPADGVIIVLIGHGTARGEEARFNLPGPDMAPAEFVPLLDDISAQKVAFVNTASASGAFLEPLAAPDRTVITATGTAREQNETVFGGYFVEAFDGEDADLDKNGRVSILEAFQYASQEVERYYEDEGLLMTEHARLVDDWQGIGEPEAITEGAEVRVARSFFLTGQAGTGATTAAVTPELAALYQRRDSLETRVRELRAVEESLEPDEYERRLEDLLVEMGLVSRQIRELEGRP
jgi:hypothetical protein